MKKVQLINPDDYFKESEKVIQIVKEREEEVRRSLPAEYKLRMAKETLDDVKSREEFDELNQKIKDLEFEIKYGKDYVPAIPGEYQNKIAFNRVHEEEKIDEEIVKQKETLLELIETMEHSLIDVLRNIENLEKRKLIGKKIDILLDEKILLDGRIGSPFTYVNGLAFSSEHEEVKKSRKISEAMFDDLKKYSTASKKFNGIKKPSILSRVLGGNQ